MVVAAHALETDVRLVGSPEAWFEQSARGLKDDSHVPPDAVALVGKGERVVTQRWVARTATSVPDVRVLAAIADASSDHAVAVVGQGARGLLFLPTSAERLTGALREFLDGAVRGQAHRREAARLRRALASLSPAEEQVLHGLFDGLANKVIAQRLAVGLRTVELRRAKIMKKMAARSLAQLIRNVGVARGPGF